MAGERVVAWFRKLFTLPQIPAQQTVLLKYLRWTLLILLLFSFLMDPQVLERRATHLFYPSKCSRKPWLHERYCNLISQEMEFPWRKFLVHRSAHIWDSPIRLKGCTYILWLGDKCSYSLPQDMIKTICFSTFCWQVSCDLEGIQSKDTVNILRMVGLRYRQNPGPGCLHWALDQPILELP